MKLIVSFMVAVICIYLIFFKLDPWLIANIIDYLEIAKNPNIRLITLGLWVVIILTTGSATIGISIMVGSIFYTIIESNSFRSKRKSWRN